MVGKTFKTGNAVVSTLKPGTTLVVSGQGTLQVTGIPQVEITEGLRFKSKYGTARVVGITSRDGLDNHVSKFIDDGEVLYIADGTNKVRITTQSAVRSAAL